ncbi:MAG: hypothetical protein U5R31_16680 [Acidimicrobiia bacterium]|nr:hypothetical protein [Acidimicrobiia bacterium]
MCLEDTREGVAVPGHGVGSHDDLGERRVGWHDLKGAFCDGDGFGGSFEFEEELGAALCGARDLEFPAAAGIPPNRGGLHYEEFPWQRSDDSTTLSSVRARCGSSGRPAGRLLRSLAIFGEFICDHDPSLTCIAALERRHIEEFLAWTATRHRPRQP